MDKLTEKECGRAYKILDEFIQWDDTTGPCPINTSNKYWFQKLCALAERLAVLEIRNESNKTK